MAYKLYYEDVSVGDEVPGFERETDFMNWNRFAAVNDEFVYLHMDDEVGRAAGQGAAFGMGNLRQSYVLNALREWIGDEAEVREVSIQFRAVNHKHDVLRTQARVTDKKIEAGEYRVYLDFDVLNQKGERTSPGQAVVVLPSRSG